MTSSEKRQEVLEAVWSWKESGGTALGGADVGRIRTGAVLQGLIGGLIGTAFFFLLSVTVAYVAWSLSALLTLVGLASPTGLYASIKKGLDAFGAAVGRFTAWILLVPVYYLFFTPFRLLFRSGKKDAMTRWLDPEADTYWVERANPLPPKESYERLF